MNMKKSVVASMICLLMVLFAVCGLSACSDCSHEFGQWTVTKEAGCEFMGMQERVCSECGEIEKEAIPAKGHNYGEWIGQHTASCGEIGQLGHYHCDGCDADFDRDHNPITDLTLVIEHDWAEATCTLPKTCGNCGETEGTALGHINTCLSSGLCARCGAEYDAPITHIFDQQITTAAYKKSNATCDAKATYYYSCVCGLKGEEAFEFGDALGHTYSIWNSNGDGTHTRVCINDDTHTETEECSGGTATCTDRAECDVCGETYGELPTHTWNAGEVQTPATCTENGVKKYTCATCQATRTEPITSTGHSWVGTRSCESGRSCSANGCNATEPALGHNYVETSSTNADCTHAATVTNTCTRCQDSYTNSIGVANGHDIEGVTADERRVGNTCEYVYWYECRECHVDVEGAHVFQHTYSGTITSNPTCEDDGVMTQTCTNPHCPTTAEKHSYTESITVDADNRASYHKWVEGTVGTDNKRIDTCHYCGETRTVTVFTGNEATANDANDLKNADLQLKVESSSGGADENIGVNLGNVTDQIQGSVSIKAEKLEGDDRPPLPAGAENQIGDNPVYNFTINDGAVHHFGTEYVTVTVPYTLDPEEDADAIFIWFVTTDEQTGEPTVAAIKAEYNEAGYVTFKTNHFSYYTVTSLTPEQRCAVYTCSYRETVVEGDCLNDSYIIKLCVRCHKTVKEITEVADGHNYSTATTPATCTTAGKTVHTCVDCGRSHETKLPAIGHAWTNTVVAPTCEANGYTHHDCDNCEYAYDDTYVAAIGHQYAATWTWAEDGSSATVRFTCANDATHTVNGTVTATAKIYPASCTKGARTEYTAKALLNGVAYTDVKTSGEGAPNGHTYTEWRYDENQHWHVCTVCGVKDHTAAHTFKVSADSTPATCENDGHTVYTCDCGYSYEVKVDALGHAWTTTVVSATCDSAGYTHHVCSRCEKSYDDTPVAARGHRYTPVWTWADNYSTATVLFVCANDNTHTAQGTVTVSASTEPATCTKGARTEYTAKATLNGIAYTDVKSTGEGTPNGHSFGTQWIYDQNGHWNKCANCDEKANVADHTFATSQITKPATCVENGERTYTCECGATKSEVIEKTGNHIYENGACITCGKTVEVCQHTNMRDVALDLSAHNGCEGSEFIYQVCDCGYKYFDIDNFQYMFRMCLMEIIESDEWDEENGTFHEIHSEKCMDCGLCFYAKGTGTVNGCIWMTTYDIKITKGDTVLLDGVSATYVENDHNAEIRTIDLSQYSTCGGSYLASVCKDCGDVLMIGQVVPGCFDGKFQEHMDTNSGTEADGSTYMMATIDCPDCGLKFVQKMTEKVLNACETLRVMTITIYKNGEIIEESSQSIMSGAHEMVYEYELPDGNTCKDGYLEKITCKKCGFSNVHRSVGHVISHQMVNLDQYTPCGGHLWGDVCEICGVVTEIYELNVNCRGEARNETVVVDGVTRERTTMICKSCGLKFVMDEWEEQESACITVQCEAYYIYQNNELIIQTLSKREDAHHDFEYEISKNGATCDDGWTMNKTCTVCGETERATDFGHYTETKKIDLSAIGICENEIFVEYCVICNQTKGISDLNCNWYYVDETEDGSQIFICEKCQSIKLVKEVRGEPDDKCEFTVTVTYTYANQANPNNLYTISYSYQDEDHEFEICDVKMNGTTCDEGYTFSWYCTKCGQTYNGGYASQHMVKSEITNLDELGMCEGAYAYKYVCRICHMVTGGAVETYGCDFVKQGTENGFEVSKCRNCETVRYIKRTYSEKDENCHCIETTIYKFVLNGETIYEHTNNYPTENHKYVYDYDRYGETCDDGYWVTVTCEDCDWTESGDDSGHRSEVTLVELDQFGMCKGAQTRTEICQICGEISTNVDIWSCNWGPEYEAEDGFTAQKCERCHTVCYCKVIKGEKDEDCRIIDTEIYLFERDGEIFHTFNHLNSYTEHDYQYDYDMQGESCEDGYKVIETCKNCDYYNEWEDSHHGTRTVVSYDLSEYGACNGYFGVNQCVCKKYTNTNYWFCDGAISTQNQYRDEQGRLHYVEVYSCSTCGLYVSIDRYSVRDAEACTLETNYSVAIAVGSLVDRVEFTSYSEAHDYEVTYQFAEGVTSCEGGVTLFYACKDCEHSYDEFFDYHQTYEIEHIDLDLYGSTCHGYMSLVTCACGANKYLEMGNALCELDDVWTIVEIENALAGPFYNIMGNYTYGDANTDAHIYTCAVTDPEKCNLRILKVSYWLHDEASCTAKRYERWWFGYNEETGEYAHEIEFFTGDIAVYHSMDQVPLPDPDPNDEFVTNGTKNFCTVCNSYNQYLYTCDEDGNIVKDEYKAINTLQNTDDRYVEKTYEYFDDYRREYEKIIYADGNEYISDSIIDYTYTAFGCEGYKETKHVKNNGEEYKVEIAYVSYKNHTYMIYEYRIENEGTQNEYWSRTDYSAPGCDRTETYCDSEGNSETKSITQHCGCGNWETVKEATCTQPGLERRLCCVCNNYVDERPIEPNHDWTPIIYEEHYYCAICGLENSNGASGDIVMEDLTAALGNNKNYVVGYYVRNEEIQYLTYVVLVLPDGYEEIIDVEILACEDICGYYFSKAEVEAFANALGLEDYDVRFTFSPYGADNNFDYAITFTEEPESVTVTEPSVFVLPAENGECSFKIVTEETADWEIYTGSNFYCSIKITDDEAEEIIYDSGWGEYNYFVSLDGGKSYTVYFHFSEVGYEDLYVGFHVSTVEK